MTVADNDRLGLCQAIAAPSFASFSTLPIISRIANTLVKNFSDKNTKYGDFFLYFEDYILVKVRRKKVV